MVNKYNLVWNLDQYIRIIVVVVVEEGKQMDHTVEDKHMDRIAEESE
jgi:hypothetical protein